MKYSTADDLPIILKEFLNHIYVVKNKSSLTIDEYALDLKMFLRFLKRQKALVPSSEEFDKIDITDVDIDFLKNVTLMDAYAFLSYCKNERNNDSAARARKVTSIRMFSDVCQERSANQKWPASVFLLLHVLHTRKSEIGRASCRERV